MVEERVTGPRSGRHGRKYGRPMAASGPDSTAVHAIPLAGERFTGTESIEVTAPYDGAVIGRVPGVRPGRRRPGGGDGQGGAGRRTAAARGSGPRSSTRAARLLAERREEFARIIAAEAAKPIKTARVEAERAVGTFRFAAAEARTLAGEMVPMDANDAGDGKLGFTLRVPDRRRRRDQPVQLPAQPRRPQGRARRSPPAARWC